MKVVLNIVSILLILVGVIWFLQGINVLLGSFMTGQPLYAVLGAALGIIGVGLLVFTNRRTRANR